MNFNLTRMYAAFSGSCLSMNGPTPEYLNQLSVLSSFVLVCICNKSNSNLTEVVVYKLSKIV
jgi:hypothetical protein